MAQMEFSMSICHEAHANESVKTYEGTHDIHNLILETYLGIQSFTREPD